MPRKCAIPTSLNRRDVLAAALAAAALPALRILPAAAGTWIAEVAPGVFVHQGRHETFNPANAGDISNPGFVVGESTVAVIDTGGSPVVGKSLREAVRSVTALPIRYVVNTHMHPDHVFGNVVLESEGATFVAHQKMARGLTARADRYLAINAEALGPEAFAGTKIVLPTVGVDGRRELDLGGRTLQLVARATAHTDNDLTVLDTKTGTMFMGDLIFSGHVPTIDGSLRGWQRLLDTITAEAPARIVPGHGPAAMAWSDAATPLKRYLAAVADDVKKDISAGRTLAQSTETAGRSEKDAWVLFDEYHKRNVSAAFAELEWE
ncbi:MAG: quinoprotein relay system zinc metallohydrolase 2 [Hyphomicrobium sp.]|nr:quinoprotein relay system zinc metallohydrolase 2 [Hyphomicrobium sp.]